MLSTNEYNHKGTESTESTEKRKERESQQEKYDFDRFLGAGLALSSLHSLTTCEPAPIYRRSRFITSLHFFTSK
ncbi:MAG: hypothetical protein RLZZ338_2775 [Cyanobacteriota bacterium]|jgi:hypothetical protein